MLGRSHSLLKKIVIAMVLCASVLAQVPDAKRAVSLPAFNPFFFPSAPALNGLWLNVGTGQITVSGTPITIPTQRLALAANTKTYVYLDMVAGVIGSNTTGFSTNVYPVAIATTNATMVYNLQDVRPDVFGGGSGGGGGASGTVSPNAGNANAIADYPLAASSTTVNPNPVATVDPSGNFFGASYASNGSYVVKSSLGGGYIAPLASNTEFGILNSSGTIGECINGLACYPIPDYSIWNGAGGGGGILITATLLEPFFTSLPFIFSFYPSYTYPGGGTTLLTINGGTSYRLVKPDGTDSGTALAPNDLIQNVLAVVEWNPTLSVYQLLNPQTTSGGGGCASGCVLTAPTTSQTVIQPTATTLNENIVNKVVWATPYYNWVQSPSGSLTGGSPATVTLTPCPAGVDTSNFANGPYSAYVAGTGTAEAVAVTGGSCTPGGASGTITFTPVNSHSAGFTVGSASTGIQEAWNDGCGLNGTLQIGYCEVHLLSAESTTTPNYQVYAPVFLTTRGSRRSLFSGYGSYIQCNTRSRCFFDGTLTAGGVNHVTEGLTVQSGLTIDGTQILDVTAASGTYTVHTNTHPFSMTANAGGPDYVDVNFYVNTGAVGSNHIHGIFPLASVPDNTHFTFTVGSTTFANAPAFGWAALENAIIEDNANDSIYRDIHTRGPNSTTFLFSYGLVFDNDQKATVDNFTVGGPFMCLVSGSGFCGTAIYARGDQSNASVVTVQNSDISMACGGNGILALSGNGFTIKDSVVQGGTQWNIFMSPGLVGVAQENVYEEAGISCTNQLYGSSTLPTNPSAGTFIGPGGHAQIVGAGAYPIGGELPIFVTGGASGNTRNYFVVAHQAAQSFTSAILPIGQAIPTSGAVSIPLTWPNLAFGQGTSLNAVYGAITWDILVTTGTSITPLYGTGNFALTAGLTATCGNNGMCSFTDTQPALTSYTVAEPNWFPSLWYWPGSLVSSAAVISIDELRTNYISTWGTNSSGLTASMCGAFFSDFTGTSMQAPESVTCSSSDPDYTIAGQIATVMQSTNQSNSSSASQKGILNLSASSGNSDFLTIQDSNKFKTAATPYYRPAWDAADLAFGSDCSGANGCMTIRAGQTLHEYINNVGDGSSWVEGLSSTFKTLKLPLDLTSQSIVTEVANASSTGTTLNKLAKLTGAPSTVVLAATTDTAGVLGICVGNCTTTGNAQIATEGQVSCAFDGATTADDYVQISTSIAGDCTDAGVLNPPASGQIIGRVLSTNGGAGTYNIIKYPPDLSAGSSGSFTNPMTTLGDIIIENAVPTPSRLPGPTTPNGVPQLLTDTPSGGAAALESWALPGVTVDTQSSSAFTVAATDRVENLQSTNSTGSTAVAIPQAGSTSFGSGFAFVHTNTGSVVATDTPTTSAINGNATAKLVGAVAGHNPEAMFWWSDNANYWGAEILPTDANGRLGCEGFMALTGDATNTAGTCAMTVGAINGTTVPTSAKLLGTNGSAQPIAAALTSAHLYVGNGSNLPVDVAASGDVTLANTGAFTVTQVEGAAIPASSFFLGSNSSSQLIAAQPFVVNAKTATYQVLAADFAGCKTIPAASGTFTVTLVASGSQPPSGQCIWVENYGSGVVTVARSGQNINGTASNITLPVGSASAPSGAFVYSDGTNYEAFVFAPAASSSVNSITGDGTIISNSASTGSVTLTLANAGAGTVLANSGTSAAAPSYISTPVLGKSGTAGTIGFGNATSGIVTLGTVAGALGTVTASLPANTGIIAELNLAQSWTAAQALGSSTATTQAYADSTTKLATTAFVAAAITGSNAATAVLIATTANLTGTYVQVGGGIGDTFTITATGTTTIDGVAITAIGQPVLLKNQSTASQNGIYAVTVVGTTGVSTVFTRALDYDTVADVNNTGPIFVQSGTANAITSWLLTSQVTSIGSAGSSLTYSQSSSNPANLVLAVSPGAGIAHFAGSTQTVTSSAIVAADITNNTITGTQLASSLALVTPNIGAATGTSLIATGIVDGKAPVTITTGTTATLGAATYSSGYTFNQEATAGTGVTYTLPATATGLQYCVRNSIVSGTGAADTGVLTVYPPASSYVILNGVRNTIGGGGTHGVASGGAAGDSACFVAIDATDWEVYVQRGTWTAN